MRVRMFVRAGVAAQACVYRFGLAQQVPQQAEAAQGGSQRAGAVDRFVAQELPALDQPEQNRLLQSHQRIAHLGQLQILAHVFFPVPRAPRSSAGVSNQRKVPIPFLARPSNSSRQTPASSGGAPACRPPGPAFPPGVPGAAYAPPTACRAQAAARATP